MVDWRASWLLLTLKPGHLMSHKVRTMIQWKFVLTSSITQHIWWIHWVMASDVPVNVTARSVELGSISLATWIEHPVTSRISFIFDPPLPIGWVDFCCYWWCFDVHGQSRAGITVDKEKKKVWDWNSFYEAKNPFKSLKIMEKNGRSLEIWFSLLLILYVLRL